MATWYAPDGGTPESALPPPPRRFAPQLPPAPTPEPALPPELDNPVAPDAPDPVARLDTLASLVRPAISLVREIQQFRQSL